ncbi:MAG: glycoside hydrolase family 5 protein [Luteolibacter sp.]
MKPLIHLLTPALLLTTSSLSKAADWYLHADESAHWNTLSDWWSLPEGGTHPASISNLDNFTSNGCVIRTFGGTTAASQTFGGASLTLKGSTIYVKTSSTTLPTTIGKLISYGGSMVNATGNVQLVTVTNFANHENTTIASGGATRGINLTVGTLTGNGDLTLNGDGTLLVTLNSAQSYYGTIYAAGTTAISFQNAIVSGGTLVIPSGPVVTLNANVTFSGLTTNGVVQAPGTYSAASLGYSGSGSITVVPPVPWYLRYNQSGNNWTTLTDWGSSPTGGSSPTALSYNDDYYTNNRVLRSSSTFVGGSLNIDGTTAGKLVLKTTTVVPNLNTWGTTAGFSNGSGGIMLLTVTNLNNNATNTNFDCGVSNRGFDVSINTLRGSGNLTLLGYGGGQLLLKVANANNYTGKIIMSAASTGTLTFQAPLFSAGQLEVNTGNSVVVNYPVSFSGLTIGGVAQAAGTYAPASLGFTGSGSVTVTNRITPMFGVNIAGMEWSPNQFFPTDAEFAYYQGKGLTLIRLPFKWEKIQPTLYGALNTTQLAALDTAVGYAHARGMKVLLDMHNYGTYNGDANYIGSAGTPYAAYQDVWTKLAAHYAGETAIWGYDIMNEPKGSSINWPVAAQYGIDGVRAGDTTHFIVVEGRSWSSAKDWPKSNIGLASIIDSQKKLVFSAHCYFANTNNDQYGTYDAEKAYPNVGIDRVSPFVEWCKTNQVYGHIGEFGVPNNDARWNVVLNNFLQYLSDNGISGTYWSAGRAWGSYPLSCEPTGSFTVDAPQMSTLQLFHQ